MIHRDAVGDGLKQHRFSRSGRGDDETPLTLAEGRQQIHHPHGDVRIAVLSGGHFQVYPLLGIKRGQVVEQDFAFAELRVLEIDGFNLEQREVALAFLGRPDMAGHRVPGPQIEPSFSVWASRILKMSSCLRSALGLTTFKPRAISVRSLIVFDLRSSRLRTVRLASPPSEPAPPPSFPAETPGACAFFVSAVLFVLLDSDFSVGFTVLGGIGAYISKKGMDRQGNFPDGRLTGSRC